MSSKHISRASYGKIQKPNTVHQANLLFLSHDKVDGKTYLAVLDIICIASRFKASVPLCSKKSSEVASAFRKIYEDPDNPLTWPKLLTIDGGCEYMGETARIMQEHGVVIQVLGSYSHRGMALVE